MSIPQCFEVRLYGLHPSVTSNDLSNFFAKGIRVLGVRIHPTSTSKEGSTTNEAQVWTSSEPEVEHCLTLKEALSDKGITIARAPLGSSGLSAPLTRPNASHSYLPPSPPQDCYMRSAPPSRANSLDTPFRNLYVLGVPIDMTQFQFRNLFLPFGMVEHTTLLSQLDGAGKRRGFVLMSSHREAVLVMSALHGRYLDGVKIDISWALIQREGKSFTNHGNLHNLVIHPPSVPTPREPPPDCSVLVDNLDPTLCSNAGSIKEIFSHFGHVERVTVLAGPPVQAIIAFELPISATALINTNGMRLGSLNIRTRPLFPVASPVRFDPFQDEDLKNKLNPETQAFVPTDHPTTDLGSSSSGRGSLNVGRDIL